MVIMFSIVSYMRTAHLLDINRSMIIDDVKEGPVQSHDPDERVWEYDDDGQKIYKVNQGYNKKTSYTKEHYYGTHFWKNRQ